MSEFVVTRDTFVVQFPHLHDSKLMRIEFNRPTVQITLRTSDLRTIDIFLSNVLGMCIHSVFEENIVFEVKILPLDRCSPELLAMALHLADNTGLSAELNQKKTKGVVFQAEPAFGAEMVAICEEATWDYRP